MRIAPGVRVYLTTAISLAAVALATLSGMEAGAVPADRQWWTLAAVIASVAAAGLPAYEQIRRERLRARAERAAVDAAVAMRVTMNDALDPIVRQLGRVANATTAQERRTAQAAAIPMVLDSASHLVGSGRVRACLFRLAAGTPNTLVPDQHAGRADEPLEPFAEGTAQGDAVFAMLRHNRHLWCADLDADPPPGWPATGQHGYKSFIAVPVAAGSTGFGMLMVDSLEIGGLGEAEVPLVRLFAGLIADALAQGGAERGLGGDARETSRDVP
jgi:transcriptional regulator with GAF, ATPase, and Fis domain